MPFTIPDEAEASTWPDQAKLFGTDIEALSRASGPTGVYSGGTVTAVSGMNLAVAAGKMVESGQRFPINASTVTISTADATNPRFDIVVAWYYGKNTVIAGTPHSTAPIPATIPDGAVLLAQVYVPANDTTIASNQIVDKRVIVPDENEQAGELAMFRSALGNRSRRNTNIWITGDSMSEGAGAPSWDRTWKQLFRTAIQQPYRYGGAGFIPPQNYAGLAADATPGAPANAHIWTFTGGDGGVPDPGGSFGMGVGLRSRWMQDQATTTVGTLVFYGDAVRTFFLSSTITGTATHTIDGGTPTGGAFNTVGVAGPNTAKTFLISGLPIGWHTLTVTATTADIVLEGAEVYQGDLTAGVHVWDNARIGLQSIHFDPRLVNGSGWMLSGYQPANSFVSITGVSTLDSATFTDTNGAFTARDVGEWLVFSDPTNTYLYGAAKIIGFTNSTTVTLDRNGLATGGSKQYRMARSEVATWSFTSGSNAASSTTAAFTTADEGKYIINANVPSGTQIQRVNSATSVTLNKLATGTAGSQTVRILNRESFHASADLLMIELGINDQSGGMPAATYKEQIRAIGIGGPQRMAQDRCSVMLVGLWAPTYEAWNSYIEINTTNGSNVITLTNHPTGIFTADDIGRTVSAAGAPGTAPPGFAATVTISSIGQDGSTAVVSANANATQSGGDAQIVNRRWSDEGWQPYRRAMRELAAEQGWAFVDLYDFAGYISQLDPMGFTTDLLHPGQRGHEWLADRFNQVLSGLPKTASIPAGIFDRAGQMVKAVGADTAKAVPGVLTKITADTSNSTSATFTDITEWQFYLAPNETLSFQFNVIFTSAAAGTGIVFRLTPVVVVPAVSNAVDLIFSTIGPTSTGGATTFNWYGVNGTAWTTAITILGSVTTTPINIQITGSVTAGAVGGLITPQFATEVNASAVTLQRGSWALIV